MAGPWWDEPAVPPGRRAGRAGVVNEIVNMLVSVMLNPSSGLEAESEHGLVAS
jgi:hypothetical protein